MNKQLAAENALTNIVHARTEVDAVAERRTALAEKAGQVLADCATFVFIEKRLPTTHKYDVAGKMYARRCTMPLELMGHFVTLCDDPEERHVRERKSLWLSKTSSVNAIKAADLARTSVESPALITHFNAQEGAVVIPKLEPVTPETLNNIDNLLDAIAEAHGDKRLLPEKAHFPSGHISRDMLKLSGGIPSVIDLREADNPIAKQLY